MFVNWLTRKIEQRHQRPSIGIVTGSSPDPSDPSTGGDSPGCKSERPKSEQVTPIQKKNHRLIYGGDSLGRKPRGARVIGKHQHASSHNFVKDSTLILYHPCLHQVDIAILNIVYIDLVCRPIHKQSCYIDALQDITQAYNSSVHHSIKMATALVIMSKLNSERKKREKRL